MERLWRRVFTSYPYGQHQDTLGSSIFSDDRNTDYRTTNRTSTTRKTSPRPHIVEPLPDRRDVVLRQIEKSKLKVQPKSPQIISSIHYALKQNNLLRQLDAVQRNDIVNFMTKIEWLPHDVIMEKGDKGDRIYVLTAGKVEVTLPSEVKTLTAPCTLGELALWYDQPRSATVTTLTSCIGYYLKGSEFESIVTSITSKRNDEKEKFIKKVMHKYKVNISASKMRFIVSKLELEEYRRGDIIIHQGTYGDKMYILESGSVNWAVFTNKTYFNTIHNTISTRNF